MSLNIRYTVIKTETVSLYENKVQTGRDLQTTIWHFFFYFHKTMGWPHWNHLTITTVDPRYLDLVYLE